MRKWILLLALGGSIGAFLIYHSDRTALEPFRASFLTIIFTITTFSVMFSMGGFNASAYRQFHRALPSRLVWSCVALLSVALLPLIFLVLWPNHFVSACLFVLPMLAMAGAVLLEVGRRETDPLTLIDRLCSLKAIEAYLCALGPKIEAKISETKALELSKIQDRPTHEASWHLPVPSQRDDPLTSLAVLGLLAIQHGDLHAFGRVVNRFLEALKMVENVTLHAAKADNYRVRAELRSQIFDAFQRIVLALQRDKGTVSLAREAIDTLAEFVVAQASVRQQTQSITFAAIGLMETLATHCYESGSGREVRVPLIVARQIVQKGVDDPPQLPDGEQHSLEVSEFYFTLPQLTNVIKRLGNYAIANNDTELLYRCLDAFGWLGCSAVKRENQEVVTACLRALSQLGREVRAKELECFDSHCPVRPEDHAVERIDWITTWVSRIPDDRRQRWADLLNCAYSRLSGKETELKFATGSDGKPLIEKCVPGKEYVEGYIMHGGARDVDYSDFTFLKDLELRGVKGILMQGPIVPLSFSGDDGS